MRTALRRGYSDVKILAISILTPRGQLPGGTTHLSWSDVYRWLTSNADGSNWARRAASYMEIAEARLSEDGYLNEGTLTVFSGIPFDDANSYNYQEAKRILRLALDDLRSRKKLAKELSMNPAGTGRGAITGRDLSAVWDFLRLADSPNDERLTKSPHLTFAIERECAVATITIPNGIKAAYRRALISEGRDGFLSLIEETTKNLEKVARRVKGASPRVIMVQRRYPARRSAAIMDARLSFDLRASFKGKDPVKYQPQWLDAAYDAISSKKSNLQFAIGTVFPYRLCRSTKSTKILDHVENTWLACRPVLDAMLGT